MADSQDEPTGDEMGSTVDRTVARLDTLPSLLPRMRSHLADYYRDMSSADSEEARLDAAADLIMAAGGLIDDALEGEWFWDWEHTRVWKGYFTYAPDADWEAETPPEPISEDPAYGHYPPDAKHLIEAIRASGTNGQIMRALLLDL